MKVAMFRGLLALGAVLVPAASLLIAEHGAATRTKATPVSKVLEMMKDMTTKGQEAMLTEQQTYATYKDWYMSTSMDLNYSITTAKSKIEDLDVAILKLVADQEMYLHSITDLNITIAGLEAEVLNATTVRKAEADAFKTKNDDQASSVDALKRAIKLLESEASKAPQAVELLHKVSRKVPGVPLVLLELKSKEHQSKQAPAWEAPTPATYEFQSGGVIGMLEGLLKSFEADRAELIKMETTRKHFYELDMQSKNTLIEQNTRDKEISAKKYTVTTASLGKAREERTTTFQNKQADSKLLRDTEDTFRSKTLVFSENQRLRKEELEALSKAIEIIGSKSVAEGYAEHVKYGGQPAAFFQVRSRKRSTSVRHRASDLLARKSRALGSRHLAAIAASASAGPLDKVIGMINDLVTRLRSEAEEENAHKIWCDGEVRDTQQLIDDATNEIDRLNGEAQDLINNIEEQSNDISTYSAERAELIESIATLTAVRTKEKEANEHAISDAKEGINAVKQAITILDTFYNPDETPVLAEVQQAPKMDEYKGQFSGGVMEMLRVIQTDLERLLSDTSAAEQSAAEQFSIDIPLMEADAKEKQNSQHAAELAKDSFEFDLGQKKKDIAGEEAKLKSSKAYFEKLRPSCLEVHVDYKVRVQKREEEIQALKQAYDILDSKGSL